MRGFMVLSALIAVAVARPEAGYSYNRPSIGGLTIDQGANLGVQGLQTGGLIGGGGYRNQYSTSNQYSTGNLGIQSGSLGLSNSGISNQYSSSGNAGGLLITGAPAPSNGGGLLVTTGGSGFNQGIQSSGFSQGIQSSGFNTQQYVQQAPLAPLIQKHIYVHVPPPDLEETQQQRIIGQAVQPTKHYKIIFIKAPSAPAPTQAQILAQQQANEEKTLIYVLSKKPEDVQDITLPTALPTQPSKPEVYFIKYKTNKQNLGGGVINGGVIANSGGIGLTTSQLGSGISSGSIGSGLGSLGVISSQGLSSGSLSSGSLSSGSLSSGSLSSGSLSSGGNQVLTSSYGPPGRSGPY